MKRVFRLPNGSCTTDAKRYTREWRKLGNAVIAAMGWPKDTSFSFDPDFGFFVRDQKWHPEEPAHVPMSVEVALRLAQLHDARAAHKEARDESEQAI